MTYRKRRKKGTVPGPPEKKIFNLTPFELYMMTANFVELEKLGLNVGNLLFVLQEVSNLEEKSVSVKEVIEWKSTRKSKSSFLIKKEDFIIILEEAGKVGETRLVENLAPDKIDENFLKTQGLMVLFPRLSFTPLVLSKIKFEVGDLKTIGISEKLLRVAEERVINITLIKPTENNFSVRANKCPLKKRCESLFDKKRDRRLNNFSCHDCLIYAHERVLTSSGYFRKIDECCFGHSSLESTCSVGIDSLR